MNNQAILLEVTDIYIKIKNAIHAVSKLPESGRFIKLDMYLNDDKFDVLVREWFYDIFRSLIVNLYIFIVDILHIYNYNDFVK